MIGQWSKIGSSGCSRCGYFQLSLFSEKRALLGVLGMGTPSPLITNRFDLGVAKRSC